MFVWFKGQCIPQEQASVPITDRGFLFGEGVFRTLRVSHGVIELYHLQTRRFQEDCLALGIEPPEINPEWIRELIHNNNARKDVWRLKWIATALSGLLMTLEPYVPFPNPCKIGEYPFRVQGGPSSKIKSLSYIERILAANYAKDHQFQDVMIKSPDGYITETAMANIFWKEGDMLMFPDPELSFMEGVTVQAVKKVCSDEGIQYQLVKKFNIPFEANVFLCNSMRGIVSVDSPYTPDHTFTRKLVQAYKANVDQFHFK